MVESVPGWVEGYLMVVEESNQVVVAGYLMVEESNRVLVGRYSEEEEVDLVVVEVKVVVMDLEEMGKERCLVLLSDQSHLVFDLFLQLVSVSVVAVLAMLGDLEEPAAVVIVEVVEAEEAEAMKVLTLDRNLGSVEKMVETRKIVKDMRKSLVSYDQDDYKLSLRIMK